MKKKKLLAIATTLTAASVVLSGCVQRTSSGKPYGFVYDHMAVPTQPWVGNYLADVRRPFDFNARHAETIKKRNDSARKNQSSQTIDG